MTRSAPAGILSLEFATTAERAEHIAAEWTGAARKAFYINTVLDYFYLLIYGSFLAFTSYYYAMLRPGTRKAGIYAARAGMAAAFLDGVENLLMVGTVSWKALDAVTVSTTILAAIKFLSAGFALGYIVVVAFGPACRKKAPLRG